MKNGVLFIDGENFLHKIREVLKTQNVLRAKVDIAQINLSKLFAEPLRGLAIKRKIFYASKIHSHPETLEKSSLLINFQRSLRNNLVRQGFEFVIAGNVRAQKIGRDVVFREKGVDVKIAVDMVTLACDKTLDCAILCSSDSDLQPAVKELTQRKIEVIYLGFETNPNKGLSYTTNRTILLRNPEVLGVCPKKKT